jgi:hypothetical protein
MASQVPVVQGHLEVIGGVIQDMNGHGALPDGGVRAREHGAAEQGLL